MTKVDRYIAIDWGTTNRRAYVIAENGEVLDTFRDERGILSLMPDDYPAELATIRSRLGDLPIIAAGMVGSTRGWREAPYVAAPAGLSELAAAVVPIPQENIAIVPGVSVQYPGADVMRGEEVQVLGAGISGLAPNTALFCQPGTHNKWVELTDGRIANFRTAMTGELFSLLRGHGILSGLLNDEVQDGPAFRAGIARGSGARDLTFALFEIRSAVLLGKLEPEDAASFASGLLIGNDVGALSDLPGRTVYLLASGPLADLYAIAIRAADGLPVALDSHASFAAGIHAIWKRLATPISTPT